MLLWHFSMVRATQLLMLMLRALPAFDESGHIVHNVCETYMLCVCACTRVCVRLCTYERHTIARAPPVTGRRARSVAHKPHAVSVRTQELGKIALMHLRSTHIRLMPAGDGAEHTRSKHRHSIAKWNSCIRNSSEMYITSNTPTANGSLGLNYSKSITRVFR